jgi:arylsulfatase A-like enzyme
MNCKTMKCVVVAIFLCISISAKLSSASELSKPNIIVFYTDDHGYADLGIQGAVGDVKTPHIDALGRSGVIAKNGYSTAPQCVPSRAGLMVGKFQGRFDVDSNSSSLDGFNKETTIATRLQREGYVTAQFGKWHLGPTEEIPMHGFKHVFSQNAQRPFSANIAIDGTDRPMSDLAPGTYHVDGCSRAAASIIERYRESPFFLYIAYRAPHTPLDAPKSYTKRFPGEMPERRRQALAMISAVDDGVGLITSTLKKYNLSERTLIFLIGDNGAPLKIHKVDSPVDGDAGGWDGSLNTPLNGEKGMLAEGGMHVPFVIALPGTIPGGQVYEHPVSALDVAATASAIAGVSIGSGELDGINLLPYLKGDVKAAPHEALYWRWVAQSAIREGNWKLLRGGNREYLYDLSTDIEEKNNLAQRHPAIATRLRAKLTAWGAQLTPPGIAIGSMAATWNDYFDHYLDGKIVASPPGNKGQQTSSDDKLQGWQARGGSLTMKDGVIVVEPEKGNKTPFITRSQLKIAGPLVVALTMKASSSGVASIAWRTDGEKDFVPTHRVQFDVATSQDWKSHVLPLPVEGKLIHLRVLLTNGTTQIKSLELKTPQGKTVHRLLHE